MILESKIESTREAQPELERSRADGSFLRESVNEESRTVELSFSSEREIEIWPGAREVLHHDIGAADFSRLENGGNLLFNHNRSDVLGVVETVCVGADKKGRATVRFGNSQRAQEVFRDVKDGILRNTSVGYKVRAYDEEQQADGTTVYHVRKWEPTEISLVTVPADISTGVDRADNTKENNNMLKNRYQRRFLEPDKGGNPTTGSKPETPVVVIEEERSQAAIAERNRISIILEVCRSYNSPEIAEKAIKENLNLEQVRGLILEKVNARETQLRQASSPVGLSAQEVGKFRFMNLIRALAFPSDRSIQDAAAFELDACRAAADQVKHRSLKGVMIPTDVLMAPLDPNMRQRDNAISVQGGAGYTGTGGNVIANTLLASAFIEILRHKCVLMKLGTELGGLVGNFEIPRMTSSQFGGGWIGEDAVAPNTQLDFGQIPLTPKTAAAYVYITRKMLMQPSIGIEALARKDIALKLAQVIDLAGYYGTGTAADPVGIKNVNGINAVAFTAQNPTFAELVSMETHIALDDADVETMSYIANAAFRGYAKTTMKFPLIQGGGGTITQVSSGGTIWGPGDQVNGYNAATTNQVATGDVFFGNFGDLFIGLWGGLEILADPYSKSTQGGLLLSSFQDVDIALRRLQSFCYGCTGIGANQA